MSNLDLFDERGREIPDPTPVAMPAGVGQPEPLHVTIKRMIRNEMSQFADSQGQETFEEANDFDVDDEDEMRSNYEFDEMAEDFPIDRLSESSGQDVAPSDKLKPQSTNEVNDDGSKLKSEGSDTTGPVGPKSA